MTRERERAYLRATAPWREAVDVALREWLHSDAGLDWIAATGDPQPAPKNPSPPNPGPRKPDPLPLPPKG